LQLGIPTANLPVDTENSPAWLTNARSGVYFGWASLKLPSSHPDHHSQSSTGSQLWTDFQIFPMVMSIGYNPFYKNTVRSAEVHVLHKFQQDFYDSHMRLMILGFIREEKDYSGLDALIADINLDCEVAKRSLDRKAWRPKEMGAADGEGQGRLDGSWLVKPLGA
jgi:riboflavin kinase